MHKRKNDGFVILHLSPHSPSHPSIILLFFLYWIAKSKDLALVSQKPRSIDEVRSQVIFVGKKNKKKNKKKKTKKTKLSWYFLMIKPNLLPLKKDEWCIRVQFMYNSAVFNRN